MPDTPTAYPDCIPHPNLSDDGLPSDSMSSIEEQLEALLAENAALKAQAAAAQPRIHRAGKPPKVPDPTPFNGNANDITRFVEHVSYWTLYCATDEERILLTGTRLTGPANAWHSQYSGGKTYSEYIDALAAYFQDPRRHERAVKELRKLTQDKRVAEYNRSFTQTVLRLEPERQWPEYVLIDLYLDGLSHPVRSHVEARERPATLESAQRAAIVAAGEEPAGASSKTRSYHQQPSHKPQHQQRPQRHNGPTPMEIGAVQQGGSRSGPQPQRLQDPKLWPPPHKPANPCPICNKLGHWKVNCPLAATAASN